MVPAAQYPVARCRRAQGRQFPLPRQGRRRQGAHSVPVVAAARAHDARGIRGGLGRAPGLDDAARGIARSLSPVRHHLVPRCDSQIPSSPRRGARCLVLPAGVCAGLAAVFPNRHRQGARASQHEHARRAYHRPRGHRAVRERPRHPAHLSVRAYDEPHRRRTRRPSVPAFAGVADRLLPGPPCRRFRCSGSRARKYPQFSHRVGAHPRHRLVVHVRIPGGDVPLLAAADLDRAGVLSFLHWHLGLGDAVVPSASRRKVLLRRASAS